MSWSQAAPCRFLHLARERSSFTEGIVQRHLPQHCPASSSSPARSYTRNSHVVDLKQRGYCTAKLSLQHISKYRYDGIRPPRHHPAFALRLQAALAPREGRGKLALSALCQAQFPDPFHARFMLLQARGRGTMGTVGITTQRAVGGWGRLRGERGGQEANLPMFPSIIY